MAVHLKNDLWLQVYGLSWLVIVAVVMVLKVNFISLLALNYMYILCVHLITVFFKFFKMSCPCYVADQNLL